MLVSAKEMMTKALAGKYAVGQFNINNPRYLKFSSIIIQHYTVNCNSVTLI